MNKPEENELIPETADKKTIVQSAKDFMNGVLSPLKGQDIGQLVEDFTAEMTLVAEGLSEDQQKLFQEADRLSADRIYIQISPDLGGRGGAVFNRLARSTGGDLVYFD